MSIPSTETSLVTIQITHNPNVVSAWVSIPEINNGKLSCVMSSPKSNWVDGITPDLASEMEINRGAWWESYKPAIYQAIAATLKTASPY